LGLHSDVVLSVENEGCVKHQKTLKPAHHIQVHVQMNMLIVPM
jgi:hypothetical protein